MLLMRMRGISSHQPAHAGLNCTASAATSLPSSFAESAKHDMHPSHILLRRHDTPTRCREIGCSSPPQAVQAGQPLHCRLLKLLKVLGMPVDDILVAPTPQIACGQRHAGQCLVPGAVSQSLGWPNYFREYGMLCSSDLGEGPRLGHHTHWL